MPVRYMLRRDACTHGGLGGVALLEKLFEHPHQRIVVFAAEHLRCSETSIPCIRIMTRALVTNVPPALRNSVASLSDISTSRTARKKVFKAEE